MSDPRDLTRREDRVARELHLALARKLREDPTAVLAVVSANAERIRPRLHGEYANVLLSEWVQLAANGDVGALLERMEGVDQRSVALRQTSPFGGVLSQAERMAAIAAAASPSG